MTTESKIRLKSQELKWKGTESIEGGAVNMIDKDSFIRYKLVLGNNHLLLADEI